MPTQLIQPPGTPAGTATLRVRGVALGDPALLEIAIIQFLGAEKYLDPRHPDAPWTTSAYWFRPLSPRNEGNDTLLDLDYGITFHLRANQPYKLMTRRGDGSIAEERFTCPANVRKPTFKPEGWTPPAPPRGPLQAPVHDDAAAGAAEADSGAATAGPPTSVAAVLAATGPATTSSSEDPAATMSGEPSADTSAADLAALEAFMKAEAESAGSDAGGGDGPPAATVAPTAAASPSTATAVAPGPSGNTPPAPAGPGRWIAVGLVALLMTAGLAWWLWPRPGDDRPPEQADAPKQEPAKEDAKDPAPTLDSVRKFIGTQPPVGDALAMARKLAEAGKLPDAQFLLLRYGAEQGNAAAARQVGAMYDPATFSKDTSPFPGPNPTEAARWYKQAAEAADAEAAYRYGMLLKSGGTDEDNGPEKAVFWLRLAAQGGHEAARKEVEQK